MRCVSHRSRIITLVSQGWPPWLPACSTAFGAFASDKIGFDQALYWSSPDAVEIAGMRLREALDGWDKALLQQFMSSENIKPDQLPARLKGWLLKQGLATTHPQD